MGRTQIEEVGKNLHLEEDRDNGVSRDTISAELFVIKLYRVKV